MGFGGYLVWCGHYEVADTGTKTKRIPVQPCMNFWLLICPDFADNQISWLTLKWYTDNKNVARIVYIGSRKEHLQKQALQIYQLYATQGSKDWNGMDSKIPQ